MSKNIVIQRKTVQIWDGLAKASRALGVSPTQVRRHVSGVEPSKPLSKKMKELNIEVAK